MLTLEEKQLKEHLISMCKINKNHTKSQIVERLFCFALICESAEVTSTVLGNYIKYRKLIID